MPELPDQPNFCSTLHTELTPEQIARLDAAAGWQIRKSARTDYELLSPFAEIVIQDGSPLFEHTRVRFPFGLAVIGYCLPT
jgi:hypothetical protein